MDYIEDEDKETNEEESDSSEYYSDEIPVWIRGDKRWISGVTEETTCSNLVYVLLVDEGIINDKFDGMFFIIKRYTVKKIFYIILLCPAWF